MHNIVLSLDGRQQVHDAVRPGCGRRRVVCAGDTERAAHCSATPWARLLRGSLQAQSGLCQRCGRRFGTRGCLHLIEPVVLPIRTVGTAPKAICPPSSLSTIDFCRWCARARKGGEIPRLFHFIVDLSGGPCLRKRLSGCGWLARVPGRDAGRHAVPCHQFVRRDGYALGNVFDGVLNEDIRAQFADNHVGKKEACRTCWAQYLCAGGCAANAQAYSGNLPHPIPWV